MTATDVKNEISARIEASSPFIYLISFEEERVERIVTEVAAGLGMNLLRWSATEGFGGAMPCVEPDEALKCVARAPKTLTILRDFHYFLQGPRVARLVRDSGAALEKTGSAVVFISPCYGVPAELEKEIVVLDVPLVGEEEVAVIFDAAAGRFGLAVPPDVRESAIRASRGLTENEARRTVQRAMLRCGGDFGPAHVKLIGDEKKRIIRRSEVLEFCEPEERLADVGGMEDLKRWLRNRARAFTEEARTFGLPQPKGLFLLGVQGCGKSLLAKAISDLWKLPLMRLDLAALFSSRTTPEENLRSAMKISEALAPVVLWIDEVEKGFAGVEGEVTGESASAVRAFGSFITWLQEKREPVFVIATANDVEALPPELLRKGRFDEIFFVDLPDVHEREAIFAIHLGKRGRNPAAFNMKELAARAEHFTGAEIEQVIVGALYAAFSESREVSARDMAREIEETVPLYATCEEKIKSLRDWAKSRARWATIDSSVLDLFEKK